VEDRTSNLCIEPQICWALNLKFKVYWTSNLRRIELQRKGNFILLGVPLFFFFIQNRANLWCIEPKICEGLTSKLLSFEPQICGVLNLKFVVYWTSNLRWIEPQICWVLNFKFVVYWTSNLLSFEPQICWILNLKFVEYWTSNLRKIEPQIC
jgi:hypothetical protein